MFEVKSSQLHVQAPTKALPSTRRRSHHICLINAIGDSGRSEKSIWSPASDYRQENCQILLRIGVLYTDAAITELQCPGPRPCTKSKNFALPSYVNLPRHFVNRSAGRDRKEPDCGGTCTMLGAISDQWPNLSVRCVLATKWHRRRADCRSRVEGALSNCRPISCESPHRNAVFLATIGDEGVPGRCGRCTIKTILFCKTDVLLWSAVSKSSLGMAERIRLKSCLPEQCLLN